MIDLIIGMAALTTVQAGCNRAGTQMELNACAQGRFERADAELNRVWALVITDARRADAFIDRATDTDRASEEVLREAQRAWLAYRDAWCNYRAKDEARGGSMEPMVYGNCLADLTIQRTRDLRSTLEPR